RDGNEAGASLMLPACGQPDQWCPWAWSAPVSAGGFKLISGGVQPRASCTTPHRNVNATSNVTAPSCHQKLGMLTNSEVSEAGATRGEPRGTTNIRNTQG